jgi:hypothetical protein
MRKGTPSSAWVAISASVNPIWLKLPIPPETVSAVDPPREREEDALNVLAGYLCANDVSARHLQFGDGQWTRGSFANYLPRKNPVVTRNGRAG